MSRVTALVLIVIGLFVGIGLLLYWAIQKQSATMPYGNESIRLSKTYQDYDSYQDDPNNIATDEVPRVQKLVKTAPIPQGAMTSAQMNGLMFDIKFPGYGLMSMPRKLADGTVLQVYSIEIPNADQERIIVFREMGNTFQVIDDFVLDNELVKDVSIESGELVYRNPQGSTIAKRRPLQ